MLTVADALEQVLHHARPRAPIKMSLTESLGRVLAEDVSSDIDSPPFDKSMVDGYALQAGDLVNGRGELDVIEEIMAGATPAKPITAGTCSRIMTGAPLPAGADAVVMQERTEALAGDDQSCALPLTPGPSPTKGEGRSAASRRIRIDDDRCRPGQNLLRRATALRRGDIVLHAGRLIRPAEIALLAEVGRANVTAIPAARVAVLSTGDELVPAGEQPTAGQIRNSNGPMLLAAVRRAGAEPEELGIARDEPSELRVRLIEGLKCDVLIVSGGVSTGVLDLVPGLLAELGVEQVFHKIRMKPGKPLWFGVSDRTLVFGLPGNPVSSFVCFELFVKPALARLAGREADTKHRLTDARLACEFTHRGDRPTYQPAVFESEVGGRRSEVGGRKSEVGERSVTPLPWAGSADLRGLVDANSLIAFPPGDRTFAVGELVSVLLLDE